MDASGLLEYAPWRKDRIVNSQSTPCDKAVSSILLQDVITSLQRNQHQFTEAIAIEIAHWREPLLGADRYREPAAVQHLRRLLWQSVVRIAQEYEDIGFGIRVAGDMP